MLNRYRDKLSQKRRLIEVRIIRVRRYLLPSNSKRGLKVIGCGRSGTTYTAKVFQEFGVDIGHERLMSDGIASWYLGSDQEKVPLGPSMRDLAWLDVGVVHQVREPLSAISSCLAIGKISREFLANETPFLRNLNTRLGFAMRYWLYWNQKCEEIASFTYQVERLDVHLRDILAVGKIQAKESPALAFPKNVNSRAHQKVNWDNLFDEDSVLAQEVHDLGNHYGYSEDSAG